MRIVPDGDGITYVLQSGDSPELYGIVTQDMPRWADLFARKNADYGDGAKVLGVRGQYADINRKMLKLKRALWDGELLEFEGADEVIMDLIGHLFLTMYMLRFREDTERGHAFSKDPVEFVDRFIDELGGPEQALRIGGLLSEALSSQVVARCHERATEGGYEPDADAPVDPDDAEHSARADTNRLLGVSDIARSRYNKKIAYAAVDQGVSVNEFEQMLRKDQPLMKRFQDDLMAERLRDGADERLLKDYPGGVRQFLIDHESAPRDGYAAMDDDIAAMSLEAEGGFDREEFAEADARQHGVGEVGPARIVTELQDGKVRYFHEAYPGSDREPLVLVPSALIGRLEKDHYVLSQEAKGGLQELAEWAERTR